MDYKFIQPVSMQVTQEQYERDLREPLLKMGYEGFILDFALFPILVTNIDGRKGLLSNVSDDRKSVNNRYFIPDYNPELFLAIAAMTDKESPIVGEWLVWNSVYASVGGYKIGDIVQCGNPNITLVGLRKATLQELINKFANKKQDIMKKELTQELIKDLKNLIAPENVEKFDELMGIEKPMFRKEEFITGDKVILGNGKTYLVIRDCNAGDYGAQVFVFLECKINGGFMNSSEYDEKLLQFQGETEYDVEKIYRCGNRAIMGNSLSADLTGYNLIWSRE